jgi:hypothetical protein
MTRNSRVDSAAAMATKIAFHHGLPLTEKDSHAGSGGGVEVLGEGTDATGVLGEESQVTGTGCFELTVRLSRYGWVKE